MLHLYHKEKKIIPNSILISVYYWSLIYSFQYYWNPSYSNKDVCLKIYSNHIFSGKKTNFWLDVPKTKVIQVLNFYKMGLGHFSKITSASYSTSHWFFYLKATLGDLNLGDGGLQDILSVISWSFLLKFVTNLTLTRGYICGMHKHMPFVLFTNSASKKFVIII